MSDVGEDELGALADFLSDPSLWEEPPADLEDRVVAAVLAAGATPRVATTAPHPRLRRWTGPFLVGAAAAAIAIGAVLVATRDTTPSNDAGVSLSAGPAAPAGVTGGLAELRATPSGLRIELDATSLPALTDGSVYACWVKTADGLHSCGAFHTGGKDIVLWSGVRDLADVEAITITLEPAGDTDPASSGQRVLFGKLDHT